MYFKVQSLIICRVYVTQVGGIWTVVKVDVKWLEWISLKKTINGWKKIWMLPLELEIAHISLCLNPRCFAPVDTKSFLIHVKKYYMYLFWFFRWSFGELFSVEIGFWQFFLQKLITKVEKSKATLYWSPGYGIFSIWSYETFSSSPFVNFR